MPSYQIFYCDLCVLTRPELIYRMIYNSCFVLFFQLLEELGTGIMQQYRADSNVPENSRVPMSQVRRRRFPFFFYCF